MVLVKKPLRLFYSYAPEDATYRGKLEKHLSVLVRNGDVTTWHRDKVKPGYEFHEADDQLRIADIILLLISPEFIQCERCYEFEMVTALKRRKNGEAHVIPILLRVSQWKETPLKDLAILPEKQPIAAWRNPDDAWENVVEGIKKVIEEVRTSSFSQEPGNSSFSPHKMNIPYARNPLFTGRDNLLLELHKQFQANGQPQAISGLGGIGKTQTSVEYAFRYADEYKLIYWVHADTESTLIADFVSLAAILDLPEKDEHDQNVVIATVRDWLTTHGRWLLIFDNADKMSEVSAFLEEASNGYSLSTAPEGHILLTTRDGGCRTFVRQEIQKLDIKDGTQFLLKLLERAQLPATSENRRGVEQIVREMDGLPLALDQAGTYIAVYRCSPSDYLALYLQEKIKLLGIRSDRGVSKKKTEYPDSVATTWSLSFQKVEQASPAAADLLRLCAFLDPDAIPIELIGAGSPYFSDPLKQVAHDSFELDKAIRELLKFSLVRRDASERTLIIHRLVQVVLKETTLDSKAQRDWAKCAVYIVAAAFPVVMGTNWIRCQLYLPHALVCDALIKEYTLTIPEAISLLNSTGQYLQERALYSQAKTLLLHALSMSELSSSHDQREIAMILGNLATIDLVQGQHKQAEKHFKRALNIRITIYGYSHPDVAAILDNLGTLYRIQSKYEEAETYYMRVLNMREQLSGLDHLDTATTLDNLGTLYRLQGRYKEAERYYRDADILKEKLLETEHRDRATTLNNLGQLCAIQGRYDEAASYYTRVLKIRKRVLGSDHTDTATTLDNLATLYCAQGKYKEAEHHYKNARIIREKRLGSEHPDVAMTLDNLGTLYRLQGKYKEAETYYERARVIRENKLDPKHLDIATTLDNLGTLYRLQGKYKEAETYHERARVIREDKLDPEHPDIATTLDNLGTLYRLQGQSTRAETFYYKSLSIREKTLGGEHPDTADTLYNIAQLYQTRGQQFYARAESYYRRCLNIREKKPGIEYLITIEIFEHLIYVLQHSRSQNKRLQVTQLQSCRSTYILCMQSFGPEHPDTINAFENYRQMLQKNG